MSAIQMRGMNLRTVTFWLIGIFVCTLKSVAIAEQSSTPDASVSDFFPQNLAAQSESDYAKGGPKPYRDFAYADADLDGTGKGDFVVAAYTNGFSGAVRVLRKQGASLVLIAAPSFPLMGGTSPEVTAIDVDGDGKQEVDVNFSGASGRGGADWLLKWNGSTLQSIGPTTTDEKGNLSPLVVEGELIDLNGNGNLEIISSAEENGDNNYIFPVYGLVNGNYQAAGTLFFVKTFRRNNRKPKSIVKSFSLQAPSGQYVLTIVNGAGKGKLVSSAEVALNGVTVASQNQFNQQVKVIKVPVMLQKSNTLSVTLYGAPGSLLTIGVGTAIAP